MKLHSSLPISNARKVLNRGTFTIVFFFLMSTGLGFTCTSMMVSWQEPDSQTISDPTYVLREVVVLIQTLPEGWILTENELTYDRRHIDSVPSTAITNISDAVGRQARFDLHQGLTLTTDMIGPRTYHVLMTSQEISMGTTITSDLVRYVSLPYDSPWLTTSSIVHHERLRLVEMAAARSLPAYTLLDWSMVIASESVHPADQYLATKSEVSSRRERERRVYEQLAQNPAIWLTPVQRSQIARLVIIDYAISFFFGVLVTVYAIRRHMRS
jgi:hypothetical protein